MIGDMMKLSLSLLALAIAAGCDSKPDPKTLQAITVELFDACPVSANNDEAARDRCADRLARSTIIADAMGDLILWGGYNPAKGTSYVPENRSLTEFDTFVFRRIYLSLFMFTGGSVTEEVEGLTLLRLPVVFRNSMSEGSYPYPFWHDAEKWDAYQAMTEVVLVFRGSEIVAAYRAGHDESRRTQDRGPFDGNWRWIDEAGEEQPHVALFTYLLSPDNPHLYDLDWAYRAFESNARQNMCELCHAPDNVSKMNPLAILNMPNQALTSRHDLLEVLKKNAMPPGVGLEDGTRKELLTLAEEFARIGDLALDYEAEYSTQ